MRGDYRQEWTVDLAPVQLISATGLQNFPLDIALRTLDGERLGVQPVTVALMRRDKLLDEQRTIVDTAGRVHAGFRFPARQDIAAVDVVLRADDTEMARFPLSQALANPHYDVQFLPESGRWLAGIPQVMGVKAINHDGLGVNACGVILDADNHEVAQFTIGHKGMGRVSLPALPLGSYRALVNFADGSQAEYPLPEADSEGVVLQYPYRPAVTAHIPLIIGASTAYRNRRLFLVGQSHGAMHYGVALTIKDSLMYTAVPRAYFPEGIVEFSILDESGRPLASRRVYNDSRSNGLSVTLQPDRAVYGMRDSVALKKTVTDSLGRPVRGNFSLAVTDNSLVPADTHADNISSRNFLTSELMGYVEDPWYYFSADSNSELARDNLLLTQGWVKYNQTLLTPKKAPVYQAEPYFQVSGTVRNALGKPMEHANLILLAGGKMNYFADTVTNATGRFAFPEIPAFDTVGFVLQVRNHRNRISGLAIDLDLDTQPPILPPKPPGALAWFVNPDTMLLHRVAGQRENWRQDHFGAAAPDLRTIMLQEVTVTGKHVIAGSKNLNGPGQSDQALDEEQLLESADKNLLQILSDRIEGFHLGVYPPRPNGNPEFMIQDKKARLIIDGMDLEFFYDPDLAQSKQAHMEFLKRYLEQYNGEDVLGVEVMYSMRYSNRYSSHHLSAEEILARQAIVTAYIEVTTRSGAGPFVRKTPGVVHFRPMPFTWPREFYRPRYPVKGGSDSRYQRATIHWEPMLITDEHGEATVSFYTAGHTGTYLVRLEGADGNGHFGLLRQTIRVGN